MPLPRASLLILTAACSSAPSAPTPPPTPLENVPDPGAPPVTPPVAEPLLATVRIDAEPGAKRFQGVWLERAGGARWVIDYRAGPLWRSFENAAVKVTGHCWSPEPEAQAISAPHFEVATMTFASAPSKASPLIELGPERVLRGNLVSESAPAGSKLAGSSELVFRDAAGTTYRVHGSNSKLGYPRAVTIMARTVVASPAYTALPSGERLWIASVHDADADPDPAAARGNVPCPGQ